MCTPANRLARVSCSASATARPPTPKAVSSGAIETPEGLQEHQYADGQDDHPGDVDEDAGRLGDTRAGEGDRADRGAGEPGESERRGEHHSREEEPVHNGRSRRARVQHLNRPPDAGRGRDRQREVTQEHPGQIVPGPRRGAGVVCEPAEDGSQQHPDEHTHDEPAAGAGDLPEQSVVSHAALPAGGGRPIDRGSRWWAGGLLALSNHCIGRHFDERVGTFAHALAARMRVLHW